MANWILLTKLGANAEPVAVNMDAATKIETFPSRTRITFSHDDTVEVVQSISAILDLAKASNAHRT